MYFVLIIKKAPKKKMIKAKGTISIPFDSIWKKYGIFYENLDFFDKTNISSIILDSYYLDIFQKGVFLYIDFFYIVNFRVRSR